MAANVDSDPASSGSGGGLKAMVARRREMLKATQKEQKEKVEAKEKTSETWSGLQISNRCVRQEKWDLSMQGKALMPISSLTGSDPMGRDQVLIGVLSSTVLGPRRGPDGKEFAQWTLTDLDKQFPQQVDVVLIGKALDHWSRKDGRGRAQAVAGSIMAVLNPVLTGRSKTIRISFDSQLLKLGTCPSFALCKAKNKDGLDCREPFNTESACEFCAAHAGMSHCARQNQRTPVAPQKRAHPSLSLPLGSRPVPTPISGPTPSGAGLLILERAESALSALDESRRPEMLKILQELDAGKVDGATLRHSKIYDKIGALAQGEDAVGSAAKALRRRWRILMDDASRPSSEGMLRGEKQEFAKRPRLG